MLTFQLIVACNYYEVISYRMLGCPFQLLFPALGHKTFYGLGMLNKTKDFRKDKKHVHDILHVNVSMSLLYVLLLYTIETRVFPHGNFQQTQIGHKSACPVPA
jgi:hypothetical protein